MQNNIRKQFVQIASVLLLALGTVTAAHAVGQPIQTQRGVVRLGSKTQANVDAKQSSVAIGKGMVLVSSSPGRLGRPALKVSFNGASMHAKVQGTVLIAYLPGEFIQITGVEGRTYLVREGRLGEVVAIDAGKMLLVKPAAKRLPDTVDINISHFVANSPMFNGGLKLAASSLIARAIEEQSGNRYLKSTPIYFDGAGSEAVVASENPELPSIGQGLGDEGQPLNTSLTGIDAIERIPTRVAEPQLIAQQSGSPQLVAQQPGSPQLTAQQSGRLQLIAQQSGPPFNPGISTLFDDMPGAPKWGVVGNNQPSVPSRGFLKAFSETGRDPFRHDPTTQKEEQHNELVDWFPLTEADADIIKKNPFFGRKRTNVQGLVQGVQTGRFDNADDFGELHLIFEEAKIPDAAAETAFKITPTLGGGSNIILKFSNDDVPSDILNPDQFKKAFRLADLPAAVSPSGNGIPSVILGGGLPNIAIDEFPPLDKQGNPPRIEMTLVVPPEGITIKDRFFKTDTITQPNGANDPFPVLGLAAPTFLGSVFVDVTSGDAVRIEVGDRALTFGLNDDELGIFSLQAPPSDATVAGGAPGASSGLTIESDGSLNIPLNIPLGLITGATVVSKQSIGVQSASGGLVFNQATLAAGQGIAVSSSGGLVFNQATLAAGQGIAVSSSGGIVFNQATLAAGQGIAVSSSGGIVFNQATLAAGQGIAVSSSGGLVFNQATLAAGQGIAVSSSGGLVFNQATLAAGQGIAVSSPIAIRFKNSSQLAAGTAVVMQGAGTAAFEMVNSTVTAPNGEILISGGELVFSNAKLNAGQGIRVSSPKSVSSIATTLAAGQGIAVESPTIVLSNATLNAGQGIAVSSPTSVSSNATTLNAGQGIAVESPTIVLSNATFAAGQGIAVSSSGGIVFNQATLAAGQGIAVSSPKRIRFENSSQLAAVTAVVMQGVGTAALEVVNSAIATPNGEILIDQFDRIQMESAILVASVIRARVVSRSGVLQISNSTLAADKLLRVYAEGSRGMVEFVGDVNLSGRKIDIAGKTVRVKRNGTVTTGPNTTVYASTRKYNKDGFGTISEHKQEKFNARPSFSGGRTKLQGRRD